MDDDRLNWHGKLFDAMSRRRKRETALEIPPPPQDASGGDIAEEELAFRAQLDKAGLDQVRMCYQRSVRESDPLKFKWMEARF